MDRQIVAVVMAGGTGTRLYPASRSDRPKQFLSFGGDRSLLERTVDRAGFADGVVVSTREAFADDVAEHAPDAEVLVEPEPMDTGPALVYAAHRLRDVGEDPADEPVLLCLPSDHHVAGDFETPAHRAAAVASETGDLVTLGIEPDRPATGYGYVEPGADRGDHYLVEQFVEKPDEASAEALVDRGCYWNAGMFAWTPEALLREARDSPLAPLVDALDEGDLGRGFDAVDSTSVDRAILERSDRVRVVPANFEWDDLGAWDAVGRIADGPLCDVLEIDASGNVIAGDDVHVTTIGVSDLVVVAFDDRVLVVPVDEAQRVREAVELLEDEGLF